MTNDNFEVGDIVEYFRGEADCTQWDGSVGIIESIESKVYERCVVAWISCRGGLEKYNHASYEAVLLRKIVLDAPFKPVLDSAHAPKEDQ